MKAFPVAFLLAASTLAWPADASGQITRDARSPHVDLVVPRIGEVPRLRVLVEDRWQTLPSGAYRGPDGAAFTVKEGAIVTIEDPSTRTRRFSVARVDAVSLRIMNEPKLVFIDARGRTTQLPDGRYTGPGEAGLVVREGSIVGFYGGG